MTKTWTKEEIRALIQANKQRDAKVVNLYKMCRRRRDENQIHCYLNVLGYTNFEEFEEFVGVYRQEAIELLKEMVKGFA